MSSRRRALAASRWADNSAISSPRRSSENVAMASPPSAGATLHPRFGATGETRQSAIAARSTFLQRTHPRWLLRASVDRWDGLNQVLPTRGDCPRKKLSSGNCSRHAPSPNRFLEEPGRIKNQTLRYPGVELLGHGTSKVGA